MESQRASRSGKSALVLVVVLAMLVGLPATAQAGGDDKRIMSKSTVFWDWDPDSVVGRSKLVRTEDGLSARLFATGLTPGDAVTMWIAFFTHPEACSTTPCSRPADVRTATTGSDLYWADGVVVGPSGTAVFHGRVDVGQSEGSLKDEVGAVPGGIPLTDPLGSEVAIALHSHGPAQTGELLHDQLTTFLGGCDVLTGVDGFAKSLDDLPDEVGECTTFQGSVHLAP